MEIIKKVYDHDKDEEFETTFPAKYEVCSCCSGRGTTYLGWHASEQPAFTAKISPMKAQTFAKNT